MAWNHALETVRDQGGTVREEEVAAAAADLLQRAHRGPAGAAEPGRALNPRERRVAARTRASTPSLPTELHPPAPPPASVEEPDEADESLAEVIPLDVFDARAEAKKRW
jgi:putative transposase